MKPYHLFYIAAIIIAVGVLPLPYGYYQIVRFVACFAFAVACYLSFDMQQKIAPFVLGFAALLFNPFMKIVLPKEVWAVIDLIAGIGLSVWTWKFQQYRG